MLALILPAKSHNFGDSSNGRTPVFGTGYVGSIPASPATQKNKFSVLEAPESAKQKITLPGVLDFVIIRIS